MKSRPSNHRLAVGLAAILILISFAIPSAAQVIGDSSTDRTERSSGLRQSLPGLATPGNSAGTEEVQIPESEESGTVAPAETIIEVLSSNPDLLAEMKEAVAQRLSEQGQFVTAEQITDEMMFQQIRSNSSIRSMMSATLIARGYLSEDDFGDEQPQAVQSTPRRRLPQTMPTQRETQPSAQEPVTHKKSPYSELPSLRDLYSQVSPKSAPVQRFGADVFQPGKKSHEALPMDVPVGPDYVLGPGDSVEIVLTGSVTQTLRRVVDRRGNIALREAGSIMVAGRTVAQAEQSVEAALKEQFRAIRAQLSVTRLRTIRVYVVGDVTNPGPYDISSLSTPLNALYTAGGPTTRGSLRLAKHYRGPKLVGEFDLYDLLLRGIREDFEHLQSGDTILVPPAGPQVTVEGMVRRPAIYELRDETNLAQVFDLAGGVLPAGRLDQTKIERIEPQKGRVTLSLNIPATSDAEAIRNTLTQFKVQDGDRVTLFPTAPYGDRTVYLEGHVFRPGKQAFREGMTVKDVIPSYGDLMPEPSSRAEIVRLMPPDMHPETIEFNLSEVLAGTVQPTKLEPFDTIRVFGRYELDAPKVVISGEVLRPGEYPLANGMKATDLLRMAGGFKRSAFRDTADITSYNIEDGKKVVTDHRTFEIARALAGVPDTDVVLKAGDVLSIRQLTGWNDIGASVTVEGEVTHPGTYGIEEGERLSSVLRRAGFFRPTAYPAGAVLERQQVRELDRRSRELLIRRIEASQPTVRTTSASEQAAFSAAFLQQQRQILDRLRTQEPTGRMVIRITADVEKWQDTTVDVEMRAGDKLTIPKRPGFVLLSGQVNNPSAISFVPGKNAGWYLGRAGGATEFGNKGKAFIIRADGSVVGRGSTGFFSGGVLGTVLRPGDTVIVPEKIIGPPWWRSLIEVGQFASSVAIAAKVLTQ